MTTVDISLFQLATGLLLMVIPTVILAHYRTGRVARMWIAALRMVLQLSLVGLYLEYLFEWNNLCINILWLVTMSAISTLDLLHTVKLPIRKFFLPLMGCGLLALGFVLCYVLLAVLMLEHPWDSQYFIPIGGILMGNMLTVNIVGLNTLFDSLRKERTLYNYMICNGASRKEAAKPFLGAAITRATEPIIASMAIIGLVSLPGTLVGQILGGSSPNTAIKYQMMVLIIVMCCNSISLWLTLKSTLRLSTNRHGIFLH